jgi:hypothetical protein
MSFKTWSKQFYPIAADRTKTGLPAIEHSLRKWEGLTKASLKKHGLVQDDRYIQEKDRDFVAEDKNFLCVDESSCALCVHYFDEAEDYWSTCNDCPLYKVRGTACDRALDEAGAVSDSPFRSWTYYGNAQPMINLIKKARIAFIAVEADKKRLKKNAKRKATLR